MLLKTNSLKYEWLDNWSSLNGNDAFSHGDIAIDSNERIYCSFNLENLNKYPQ